LLHPANANDVNTISKIGLDWRTRAATRIPFTGGGIGNCSYCYAPGARLGNPLAGEAWIVVEALCGTSERGVPNVNFSSNINPATKLKYESVADDPSNPTVYGFFTFDFLYPLYALHF
jgi:hypothetical protein